MSRARNAIREAIAAALATLYATAKTLGLGTVVLVLLLAADRRYPVHQLSQNQELSGLQPGQAGDVLVRVFRDRLCTTDVDLTMFDGDGSRFVVSSARQFVPTKLGEDSYRVYVELPRTFTPGPSRGYFRMSYRCNFVQQFWPVVEVTPEFYFTVKP